MIIYLIFLESVCHRQVEWNKIWCFRFSTNFQFIFDEKINEDSDFRRRSQPAGNHCQLS